MKITKGGLSLATEQNVRVDEVAVEMRNIVKKFGDFTANDGINLVVHKGEIHAILGENGAGKSTLMNQLYGMYTPTSGCLLYTSISRHGVHNYTVSASFLFLKMLTII